MILNLNALNKGGSIAAGIIHALQKAQAIGNLILYGHAADKAQTGITSPHRSHTSQKTTSCSAKVSMHTFSPQL